MLDRLDDFALVLVNQDNVGVFPHDLHNKSNLNAVTDFVFVRDGNLENTVIFQLLDILNNRSLKVFPHNHGIGVWILWIWQVSLGRLNTPKNRVSRKQKLVILTIVTNGQDQLTLKRLINLLDTSVKHLFTQLSRHMMKKKAVKRHDVLPFFILLIIVFLVVIKHKTPIHYSIKPLEMLGMGSRN